MKKKSGLFETMRCYRGRIICRKQHLKRLRDSCKLLGLRLPSQFDELQGALNDIARKNKNKDLRIRLTLNKYSNSGELLTEISEYNATANAKYRKGFCLGISSLRQNERSVLSRVKSTERTLYENSLDKARENGFDEALILNRLGYLCEASRSNIFLVKGGELFTPRAECGCLEGITRQVILKLAKRSGIDAFCAKLTSRDLLEADEAFLTNSLIGVMPVTRLEERKIGTGAPGRITRFFMKEYNSLLKNGI